MVIDCICGRPDVDTDVDFDGKTRATIIECCGCGRMVGGLSEQEAQSMWNAMIERLKEVYKQ